MHAFSSVITYDLLENRCIQMTSTWKAFAFSFRKKNRWHFNACQCLSMDHRTHQNVKYEQSLVFGEVKEKLMLPRYAELLEWFRCAAWAPWVERSKSTFQAPLSTFFFLSDFFCLLALRMECLKCSHNGRGTTVTHSAAPRVPSFCYYLILTSYVIYHETEARQHRIYWYLLITWQNESCTLLTGPCLWSITNILPFLSSKTGRFHVSVDHKRRQNVVITSETHSAAHREPLLCFEHISHTSPFTYCYWTGNTSHGDVITMHKFIRELVET